MYIYTDLRFMHHKNITRNDDDDGDDGDANTENEQTFPPTIKQAIEAAEVLQKFFDNKDDEESRRIVVRLDQKLEEIASIHMVQTSLSDYFLI